MQYARAQAIIGSPGRIFLRCARIFMRRPPRAWKAGGGGGKKKKIREKKFKTIRKIK
jgi:hypothetical protein